MVDLVISIIDENDEVLEEVHIYEDGSDSEAAEKIKEFIFENFLSAERL